MIKLFVTDIDGCLSMPYDPFDLDGFARLRDHAREAEASGAPAPRISVCSGRAYSYVESITQALSVRVPVLFESGGGRFDPVAAQTTWNPAFTGEVERDLETVRRWLLAECVPGTKMSLDHAKRTQAGVVTPDTDEVADLLPRVEAFVEDEVPHLQVFATENSIDVVPPNITKRTGLEWLAEHLGLALDEMAYIGDSDADIGALKRVGLSFAPANAGRNVRASVDRVTDGTVMAGTLEAYRACLAYNEDRAQTGTGSPAGTS